MRSDVLCESSECDFRAALRLNGLIARTESIPDFPEVVSRTALSAYRRVANANSSANLRLTAQEDVINIKPYHLLDNPVLHKSLFAER
jgi:hypothetical protein